MLVKGIWKLYGLLFPILELMSAVPPEDLPDIRGRAIYQTDREVTLQVPYLSDKKLSKILPNNIPLPVQSRGLSKIGDTQESAWGSISSTDGIHNDADKSGNKGLKRIKARSAPVVRLHD